VEPIVVDPEVVGDLVEQGVLDRADESLRRGFARVSGPRKSVILLGNGTLSTPKCVRGTPWYSPKSPPAPTAAS